MLELLRIVVTASLIGTGTLGVLARAYRVWVRESLRRAAGRQALTGKSKAARDRAYEILRLMEPPDKGG